MRTRGRKLIAANEPTVIAKPLLDLVVVEDGQGNGGLADSTSADESDRSELLGEIDYLLDQLSHSTLRDTRGRTALNHNSPPYVRRF